jgi:hypothetical protein
LSSDASKIYGPTSDASGRVGEPTERRCHWNADGEDSWNTGCKKHFYFTDGDPADNGFEFCPFCGGWLFIPNEADS